MSSSSRPVRPGPGRPRQPEVDARLESTVLALVRRGGPSAVTVETVAAESGLAKTTIYRRYPNRSQLLASVLGHAVGRPGPVPEGPVRDKVRFALDRAWRQMSDILGPGGLAAILQDADPEFTELFRDTLRPYEEDLVARIREDAEAGLLRPDVDADGVVSLFVGAYLGELVRRGRVDDDWLDRSLDLIWAALVPTGD